MIILYDEAIPRDFLPIISERIESLSHLLPNWCQTLSVDYSSENPNDYVMTCQSDYPYRMVKFTIFEPFFEEEDWQGNIIHELQHAIVAPFSTEAWHIFHLLKYDQEVLDYINKKLTDAEEAMAQDMTDLIKKLDKML